MAKAPNFDPLNRSLNKRKIPGAVNVSFRIYDCGDEYAPALLTTKKCSYSHFSVTV